MSQRDMFMSTVRGVPANHVAMALNNQTSGTSWTGCTKAQMADEYELAHTNPARCGRASLASINLETLGAQAAARMAGDDLWRELTSSPPSA